jgi:hypothetical protein
MADLRDAGIAIDYFFLFRVPCTFGLRHDLLPLLSQMPPPFHLAPRCVLSFEQGWRPPTEFHSEGDF